MSIDFIKKFSHERYLQKREIAFRLDPGNKVEDVWDFILDQRLKMAREIPLKDQQGKKFWFTSPPFLQKILNQIDVTSRSELEKLVGSNIKKEVILDTIFDEAYYSCVIEGAFSTKKRAKEVVKANDPKNKSERMIINNFQTLIFILENIDRELNEDLFLSVHKQITENTLEPEEQTEKYRDDYVYVFSQKDETVPVYTAPHEKDVQWMMDDLFTFINSDEAGEFIHPIIKAWIIHFYIVYVHPFFDGNGRVARAFSYMYLLKKGYSFFKFFSVSSIIEKHRNKYYKAIKDSEDYESDLTYFLVANAEMTYESIMEVIYRFRKALSKDILKEKLAEEGIYLSVRQNKFIDYINKKDNNIAVIEDYKKRYKVSYETARRELTELSELGILKKIRKGKKFIFTYLGLEGFTKDKPYG
ncbi:Fic family protein [Brevibacillus sp. NRS-1366]|uniref:Fic family protein n=1 Tax=Brevibacillus sp. NRS-1366 TaxID=3233899 RepID=UPI003D1F9946